MDTRDALAHVARLSDAALLAETRTLARREREATVALVVHLAELDARRLFLAEACPSLFRYCTDVLHLSEHAAYNRIEVARAVRRLPVLLEHLASGATHLTAVRLLAPHLTLENHREVLAEARHKRRREIEELVARLHPQPPVPDVVRRLPTRTPASGAAAAQALLPDNASEAPRSPDAHAADNPLSLTPTSPSTVAPSPPARRAAVTPLAPERYKVQFTASAALHAKLREAQALLRHQIPDGDLEQVLDRALDALLAQLRKQKLAETTRPRAPRPQPSRTEPGGPHSRHIPAAVKRTVWERDRGRCAFVSNSGRRCAEEGFLEFHHIVPHAKGGHATAENIELRCRAHNGYEAVCVLGEWEASKVREAIRTYDDGNRTAGVAGRVEHRSGNSLQKEFDSTRLVNSFRNELDVQP